MMDLTGCDADTILDHRTKQNDKLRAENRLLRTELLAAKICIKKCRDQAVYLKEHHAAPEADVMLDAIRKFLTTNKGPSTSGEE